MWGGQELKSAGPVWDIWRCHCIYSPQGDDLHQGWVGAPCWEVKCENCKAPLTRMYASIWRYIKCYNL